MDNIVQEKWDEILEFIKNEYNITNVSYKTWISDLKVKRVEDNIVYINNTFKHTNEIKCKYNDIVFALIGSVGTLARVTEQFVESYISNNIGLIRLNSNKVLAEYLPPKSFIISS